RRPQAPVGRLLGHPPHRGAVHVPQLGPPGPAADLQRFPRRTERRRDLMSRHLAHLPPPRSLHDLLYAAPHSLHFQSWAPRVHRPGTVNADGFGVGWYAEPAAPEEAAEGGPGQAGPLEPLRYRRAMPMWGDASFADAARAITSGCVVAAVRDATIGFGSE